MRPFMRAVTAGVFAIILMGSADRFVARAAQESPAPGVPVTVAEERARRISNLRYDLHFTIPADAAAPIDAKAPVRFALIDRTRPLVLDFAAPGRIQAESHGRPITVRAVNEHVLIQPSDLLEGENEIT